MPLPMLSFLLECPSYTPSEHTSPVYWPDNAYLFFKTHLRHHLQEVFPVLLRLDEEP